jgi:ATP-dependent DNA helicase RecG
MDQASLIALIDRLRSQPHESAVVEFKLNWDKAEDIGEYLSALANTAVLEQQDRAWLVWGIDDKTHEVRGTTFNPWGTKGEGNQPLIMWLTQRTSPPPDFNFHETLHPDGGRVVVLEIRPPRSSPLAFSGERYVRIGSHKTRLSQHPDKESRLWALLDQKDDWSGEVVADASLDDLDPQAIEAARLRFLEYLLKSESDSLRHEQIKAEAQGWDVTTLLNKAHVTKQGRITRSALLLLGRDEASHYLAPVDAKISWVLRDTHNRMESSQHFGTPFLLSTEKVFGRIRNITIEHMPDGSLFHPHPAGNNRYTLQQRL